jgi:hypothetical protein
MRTAKPVFVCRTKDGTYLGEKGFVADPANALRFPNRFAALARISQVGSSMAWGKIEAYTPQDAPEAGAEGVTLKKGRNGPTGLEMRGKGK